MGWDLCKVDSGRRSRTSYPLPPSLPSISLLPHYPLLEKQTTRSNVTARPILRTALKARLAAAAVAAATLADSGAETAAETAEEGEREALCGKITEGRCVSRSLARCSFLHSFLGPDTATECKASPGVPLRVRLPFRGFHARHLLSSPVP